jgi:hypothetical protein
MDGIRRVKVFIAVYRGDATENLHFNCLENQKIYFLTSKMGNRPHPPTSGARPICPREIAIRERMASQLRKHCSMQPSLSRGFTRKKIEINQLGGIRKYGNESETVLKHYQCEFFAITSSFNFCLTCNPLCCKFLVLLMFFVRVVTISLAELLATLLSWKDRRVKWRLCCK